MSLAGWGIRFLPEERLEWLEQAGLLEPWQQAYQRGGRLTCGEAGLLVGKPAIFDYLFAGWARQVGTPGRRGARLPHVLEVALSHWARPEGSGPEGAMDRLPAAERERRVDAMMDAWLSRFAPGKPRIERARALNQEPSGLAYALELAMWLAARCPDWFSAKEQAQLIGRGEWAWLRANWESPAAYHPRLPDGRWTAAVLADAALAEGHGEDTDLWRAIAAWKSRAGAEEMEVFALGGRGGKTPPGGPSLPWKMLRQRKLGALQQLIKHGLCGAHEAPGSGKSLGLGLVEAAQGATLNHQEDMYHTLAQWFAHATPEEIGGLWEDPRAVRLVFQGLESGKDWTRLALAAGFPVDACDSRGRKLGAVLIELALENRLGAGAWCAYRARAGEGTLDGALGPYLQMSGKDLLQHLSSNTKARAAARACLLDSNLPKGKAATPRVRM